MLEVWVIFCCFFENLLVIYCTAITSIASKPGKRSCACCRNSIMSNVTQAGCQQRVHQANSVNLDEPLTLAEDLAETVDSNGKKLWAVWQSLCTLLAEESTQHQTCTALKSLWNACTSDFFHLVGPWPKPDHHMLFTSYEPWRDTRSTCERCSKLCVTLLCFPQLLECWLTTFPGLVASCCYAKPAHPCYVMRYQEGGNLNTCHRIG